MTEQHLSLVKSSRTYPNYPSLTLLPTPSEPAPLPWQPLDPIAHEWAVLALCAQSAAAYTAAGRALLALSFEESARVQYGTLTHLRNQGGKGAMATGLE